MNNLSERAQIDWDLITKAKAGNQAAFADLMSRYRDSIFYMILKMIKSKEDAEDLTIEVFAKAFSNLEKYAPTYAFSTWLYRIASNHCIDFIRKKKMHIDSIDQEENHNPALKLKDKKPTPEDLVIKKELVNSVRKVIEQLNPKYRRIIAMRYFDELSYEEIAQKLSLPMGTVKAQLYRAKQLLGEILKEK